MAMNHAARFDDGRRTKYQSHKNQSIVSLSQQIQDEIARRPQRQFVDGQIVYTPDGYREIINGFYSVSGWKIRVLNNGKWTQNHLEKDCTPLFFNVGDLLTLPSGVKKVVHHISIAKSGNPILSFEIAPQQYTIYSYTELLKCNPPLQMNILHMLWQAYSTGKPTEHLMQLRRLTLASKV